MKDGEEGICHKSGWCKPATMEPDCGEEGKLLSYDSHMFVYLIIILVSLIWMNVLH